MRRMVGRRSGTSHRVFGRVSSLMLPLVQRSRGGSMRRFPLLQRRRPARGRASVGTRLCTRLDAGLRAIGAYEAGWQNRRDETRRGTRLVARLHPLAARDRGRGSGGEVGDEETPLRAHLLHPICAVVAQDRGREVGVMNSSRVRTIEVRASGRKVDEEETRSSDSSPPSCALLQRRKRARD